MKKIIIFGATGNTGTYLVDYFINNIDRTIYEIVAVGRRKNIFFDQKGIKYFSIDISKGEQLNSLPIENVHAVFLTAAKLPTHAEFNNPFDFINTNIIGSLNILEYCRKANVDRIIYTQTMSNIALSMGKETLIKPNTPKNFPYSGDHTIYVISKNTAEELIEYYHQEFGIKRFVFHIPTIYQYRKNRYWYVNGEKKFRTFQHLIDKAIEGDPIEMWGDPTSFKDMVYVKDYCQMLYKAVNVDSLNGGHYNVGTGIPVTLEEMLNGIVDIFSSKGKRSKIICKPEMPNPHSYIIDIQNAKDDLGYEPKYDYLSMLKDIKYEMEIDKLTNV